MIKFEVDFLPPSVNNYWKRVEGHIYLTKEARDFKKDLFLIMKSKKLIKLPLIENKLKVNLTLNFKDSRKRDIDNYNKGIFDGLNNLIWKDDSQIMELNIKKRLNTGKNSFEIEIEYI